MCTKLEKNYKVLERIKKGQIPHTMLPIKLLILEIYFKAFFLHKFAFRNSYFVCFLN